MVWHHFSPGRRRRCLVGWFSFHSVGFLIGGLIFAIIGMIVFINGTRTMPK
jgi:hypothetical protein